MDPPYPTAEKVPSLWFPLVKKFYQEYYPSGKPNKADPIWVIRSNGKILSAVRLKQLDGYQLLTAMVTKPSYRSTGLASHLLCSIKNELEHIPSYCFAFTNLVPFYVNNGFCVLTKNELPESLRSRFLTYTSQGKDITAMRHISFKSS